MDVALLFFTCIASLQMVLARNPIVAVEPQEITVLEGLHFPVNCKIDEPILRCSWRNADGHLIWPEEYGENSTNYECGPFPLLAKENKNGILTCEIIPVAGAVERRVFGNMSVTVAKPPRAVQINVNKINPVKGKYPPNIFEEEQEILAECRVKFGRPEARISLFIGRKRIKHVTTEIEDVGPKGKGWKTTTQSVSRTLKFLDNGKELRCIAEHSALPQGILSNQIYKLNVYFKPKPGVIEQQHAFMIGHPGNIVATIHANPKPNITWLVDDDEILEGNTTGRFHAANLTARNQTTWEAVLHIEKVTFKDSRREFKLTAKNQVGENEFITPITVCSLPVASASVTAWSMAVLIAILTTMLFIFLLKNYTKEIVTKQAKPFHDTKSYEDATDDQTEIL